MAEALEIPTEPVTTDVTIEEPVPGEQLTPGEEAVLSADTRDTVTPKRKPGRPLGSKSKEPGKPRAPRKKRVVVEEAPVEEEVPPRALPGSRPIPTHAHDDTTALMLELLRQQAQTRQTRKTDLWKSWFR